MPHTALNPSFSCNLGRLVPLNFSGLEPNQAGQIDPTTLQHSPPANLLPFCNIFTFIATSFNYSFLQIFPNAFQIFKVRVIPCCLLSSLSLPTFLWAPCVSVAACFSSFASPWVHFLCQNLFSPRQRVPDVPNLNHIEFWILATTTDVMISISYMLILHRNANLASIFSIFQRLMSK